MHNSDAIPRSLDDTVTLLALLAVFASVFMQMIYEEACVGIAYIYI